MSDNLYFYYKLKPKINVPPNCSLNEFMGNLSMVQKEIVQKHFNYMDEINKLGKILLGGPCLDVWELIFILKVITEQEADDLMSKDPTIENELFYISEKHPFQPSVGTILEP